MQHLAISFQCIQVRMDDPFTNPKITAQSSFLSIRDYSSAKIYKKGPDIRGHNPMKHRYLPAIGKSSGKVRIISIAKLKGSSIRWYPEI